MSNTNFSENQQATRPRRRHGENRERLFDAGIRVFGMKGYSAASTAEIAALADVPQPHVYANFSTKKELYLECAARVEEVFMSSQVHAQHEQFLFQMVASASGELATDLKPILNRIRQELGEQVFADTLSRAAVLLLA